MSGERTFVIVMRHLGYARLFDAPIRALLDQGHRVHLLYEREIWTKRERSWLDELAQHDRFDSSHTDALRRDRWFVPADRLRRISDLVDFLAPDVAANPVLLEYAERRVRSVLLRRIVKRIAAGEPFRLALATLLRSAEAVFPPSAAAAAELSALGADLVVVVPHVAPGNRQSEYVRTAASIGIPSAVCVASWDNLTSRQLLRVLPDRLVVWNDVQRREAVNRHGVPDDRVVMTGVQSFDEWFVRRPRSRDEFCELVGLDSGRPYVLWVGGALSPAQRTEAAFLQETWLPRLRADARLSDVSVLVRPHPRRLPEWEGFDPGDPAVVVWPRADSSMPVDEESRADYFDSIYHSAAVAGINTTAMIEAAVVGRSVHTLLLPEFEASQLGAAHFHYLLDVAGGALEAATDWDDHFDGLARAVAGGGDAVSRQEFVQEFVRPFGLEEPAVPRFVAALESTRVLSARRDSEAVRALRAGFLALLAAAHLAVRCGRAVRTAVR